MRAVRPAPDDEEAARGEHEGAAIVRQRHPELRDGVHHVHALRAGAIEGEPQQAARRRVRPSAATTYRARTADRAPSAPAELHLDPPRGLGETGQLERSLDLDTQPAEVSQQDVLDLALREEVRVGVCGVEAACGQVAEMAPVRDEGEPGEDPAAPTSRGHEVDARVRRTRAAVVDTAVELLVEGGVGAITIEAIVQRSGVARSTIYRHWPSRTDVVASAFGALITPLPEPPRSGDLRARLSAVLRGLAEQMTGQAYASSVPSILDSAGRDPELAEFRQAFTESQTRPLRQILDDAVAAGEIARLADVDGAVAQLAGPLLFRRIVLDQPVGPADADRSVAAFLAAPAP